mgnify:CR=1 FL=1
MIKLYFLLSIAILISACSTALDLNTGDLLNIKLSMQAYRDAWRSGDSAKIRSLISNEITLYMPDEAGVPKQGKEAVTAFWFPTSDISYPITKYEISNEKIEGCGSMAFYSGISHMEWHVLQNGVHADTTLSVSEFLNVLRKENGVWRLYKIIYNIKHNDYQVK